MQKIKYALVGCGRIAIKHLEAAINNDYQLVALCDISSKALATFVASNQINTQDVQLFTTLDELLENVELDVVAIATPSGTHYSIAKMFILRGINVIIEKPVTLSLKDADDLMALCTSKDVIATVCHQNRFNLSVQEVKKAIDTGTVHRIFHICAHIRWNRTDDYYKNDLWRGTWANDGGALMNQGIHNADILRWLAGGNVKEVFAYIDRLNHQRIEVEDMALALVKFDNGSYGTIEATTNVYPENLEETLYLFGEDATIKLGGKSINAIELWKVAADDRDAEAIKTQHSEYPKNIYGNGHASLYKDFRAAVTEKRLPYITIKEARDSLELVLAVYKSALTHLPISFPIDRDSSLYEMKGWQAYNEN